MVDIAQDWPILNPLNAALYIDTGNISVEFTGPPCVVSQISPKLLKFQAKARKNTNPIIEAMRGYVIYLNVCHGLAPSTLLAS